MLVKRTTGDGKVLRREAAEVQRHGRYSAFTLVELLVVLAIIGLVLALSVPSFRAQSEGASVEAAVRQLMQDLQFARQNAIATRSTVAVVFIPRDVLLPGYADPLSNFYDSQEKTNLFRLQGGPLTTYALFGFRQIGEQPGGMTPRYITPWRTLPEKTFVAEEMFQDAPGALPWATNAPFPYPLARSKERTVLPYIAFNSEGQCLQVLKPNGYTDPNHPEIRPGDVYISVANGVINYSRNPVTSQVVGFTAQEIPPGNSTNEFQAIHIDWLTGRATRVRSDISQ